MSRIGNQLIPIPDKVKLAVQGQVVKVDGPLGSMQYALPENMKLEVKDGKALLSVAGGEPRLMNMLHGTARARIANMVKGVSAGFAKILELQGLGFKAQIAGAKLNMELGFSHPVLFDIPPGIKMEVDPKQTLLTIKGADKELVGDLAARIRKVRPPEPYKGSGIRYQNEHVARKAGKTAVAAKK
ncbi:MAG TPA: 50S ribosomal protein L6 [Elusimicrobiales bacterium]|nr:50S ribosomal protein L6 [Elusimicrobiales bacterium]